MTKEMYLGAVVTNQYLEHCDEEESKLLSVHRDSAYSVFHGVFLHLSGENGNKNLDSSSVNRLNTEFLALKLDMVIILASLYSEIPMNNGGVKGNWWEDFLAGIKEVISLTFPKFEGNGLNVFDEVEQKFQNIQEHIQDFSGKSRKAYQLDNLHSDWYTIVVSLLI